MITRLSTKGQLIIPRGIRTKKGWRAGTELVVEDHGGFVALRPAQVLPATELDDLVGCTGYRGPARSLADMEAAIAKGARRRR
jgi:AbrB family looped-hinge helix DNA binding protein